MADTTLDLAGVSAAVDQYFTGFNTEDYRAVAALFESDGVLIAPFEEPLVGPEAIYVYLQAEAVNMQATPVDAEVMANPDGTRQIVVRGRVKTLLFIVNVRWTFVVTTDDTLQTAEIKLLASLQELVQMDQGQ
ncbi:MAG: ketosteroid isomerase family protein [Nodosilinea sp.]